MTSVDQSLRLDAQNPWPGLATYNEAVSQYFFGRESEIDALARLVKLSPVTALYGKSGLGKSSLLQAGLFPQLREAHFLPVYIRFDVASAGNMPLTEQAGHWLRQALYDAGADYPEFEEGESLWCYLHRRDLEIWSQDNHLLTPVFVFDQFEEVFTHSQPGLPSPRILCQDLADLLENKLPANMVGAAVDKSRFEKLDLLTQRYRVVISFREDFLPALKNWEHDVPSLLKNWFQLKPMARESAEAAIRQAGSAILSDGVAQAIVDFIGNLDTERSEADTSIEPVLLSLCCYQLNLRRQAAKADKIGLELLRKAGQEILQDYYDNALSGMTKAAEFIENKLIQGDRYRASYPQKLALDEGLLSQKQLTDLTDRHRLLRIDQQMGTPRIELIHDRLVSVVRKSRDIRRSRRDLYRAWSIGGGLLILVLTFSGWRHWESWRDRQQLVEMSEALLNRVRQQSLTVDEGAPSQPVDAVPDGHIRPAPVATDASAHLVYLQIRNNAQREAAQKVRAWLKQQGYRVPIIELLPNGPRTTEVRYFRNSDAEHAQRLADQLTQQKIPNVISKYIAGFEDSNVIPQGQYEIWFAPEAFQ